MNITIKEMESYRELTLYMDDYEIGYAEINLADKSLARLYLYEPYRNKGYGTYIVKTLTEKYGLKSLWVKSDNDIARHVYEKCGYKIKEPTMYQMEISNE